MTVARELNSLGVDIVASGGMATKIRSLEHEMGPIFVFCFLISRTRSNKISMTQYVGPFSPNWHKGTGTPKCRLFGSSQVVSPEITHLGIEISIQSRRWVNKK